MTSFFFLRVVKIFPLSLLYPENSTKILKKKALVRVAAVRMSVFVYLYLYHRSRECHFCFQLLCSTSENNLNEIETRIRITFNSNVLISEE